MLRRISRYWAIRLIMGITIGYILGYYFIKIYIYLSNLK
jgi:hypothetical protein